MTVSCNVHRPPRDRPLTPVCITSLIVTRLVRMKEFMVSKRLANRVIVLTMESM